MKKLVFAVAALLVASTAFANGPFTNSVAVGIRNTKHDLGVGGNSAALGGGTITQKCIFCHTPHNAEQNVPLWNRLGVATPTGFYNSPTLTPSAQAVNNVGGGIPVTSVSAFCMSCHDGVTGMGAIKNSTVGATPALPGAPGPGTFNSAKITSSANLTTNLQATHPVAFSYLNAATTELAEAGGVANSAGLYAIATAKTNLGAGAFFGAGGDMIECASCHKVHDNRIAPFLRVSNDASQLCLACHQK